jgi:beta-lactamase regulating signal transducer with metallopeptidase domain
MAAWMAEASPVSLPGVHVPTFAVASDFPIVAVVGWRRPTLVIARTVLEHCTPEELTAIVAHERGHIERRDNLRRLLLAAAPDVLAWLPTSRDLIARWRDAAEEAADDDAARASAESRLNLASALVKVARLSPSAPAAAIVPASALYRGESLEARVRRLLEPDPAASSPATGAPWPTLALAGTAIAFTAPESVHRFMEVLLHRLP